jgi:hypothetical protein
MSSRIDVAHAASTAASAPVASSETPPRVAEGEKIGVVFNYVDFPNDSRRKANVRNACRVETRAFRWANDL